MAMLLGRSSCTGISAAAHRAGQHGTLALEICRDDRPRHHGRISGNSGRARDSLITAEISLIARLNSLKGGKKFPVPMRRELVRKALI
jgi:hypothetical protein